MFGLTNAQKRESARKYMIERGVHDPENPDITVNVTPSRSGGTLRTKDGSTGEVRSCQWACDDSRMSCAGCGGYACKPVGGDVHFDSSEFL